MREAELWRGTEKASNGGRAPGSGGGDAPRPRGAWRGGPPDTRRTDGRSSVADLSRVRLCPRGPLPTPRKTRRRKRKLPDGEHSPISVSGLSVGHSSAKTREPRGTTLRSGGGGAGAARVTISCMRGEGTGHRLGPVCAQESDSALHGARVSVRPARPLWPPVPSGSSGNAAEARFVSAACLSYVSASPSSQTDPPRRRGAPAVKSIRCRKMCTRNF